MDDQNDHERIMEDIIAGVPNNVPTFTDEERSQADGFLNIPATDEGNTNVVDEEGSTHAGDEDDNAEGSHKVHNKLSLLIL